MKRILGRTGVICLILIVIFVLGKNFIIKGVAQLGCRVAMGLPLKIAKLNISFKDSLVDIKGINIGNPKAFKNDRLMGDIPEVYVDYRFKLLLGGKVHIDELRFHLQNFVVVKNADGTTNLDTLKAVQGTKEKSTKKKETKKKETKKTSFQLDNLSLKIDKVTFLSYDEEGNVSKKEFNINLNENHQDIKSLEAVGALIIFKVLTKTTIASLTNFDVDGLGSLVSGSVGATTDVAKKVLGSTSDTLKDTTGKLKGLIKNPFGKK